VRRTVGRHDLSTIEGQSAAVADALPILESLQDPVRRSEYGHLLADLAGVPDASVMVSLERRLGGRPQDVAKTMKRTSAQDRVEREMLRLLVRDVETYQELAPMLSLDHFRTPINRRVFEALGQFSGRIAELASGDDEKLAAGVSSLAVEPLEGDPSIDYARSVWARLQEFLLKGRSDQMRMRLQKMNPLTEIGYDELFQELVQVDGELRRLREGGSAA
jgi:DNA primase